MSRPVEFDEAEWATLEALKRAGFTNVSAAMAVRTQDMARLVHCGPFDVQLQPPGGAQ